MIDLKKYVLEQYMKVRWFWNTDYKRGTLEEVSGYLKHNLAEARYMLEAIVAENGWLSLDDDRKVIEILVWVHEFLTYKSDIQQFKNPEYWATLIEILANERDDCEGGGQLIFALCRVAGIPANKIWLQVGDVKGGKHCYVKYESDLFQLVWWYLDWCYKYNDRLIGQHYPKYRPAHFENGWLKEIDYGMSDYLTIDGFANDTESRVW